MPLTKSLEFLAVAVMTGDDEVMSLQARIDTIGVDRDLKNANDTEPQLPHVACKRTTDFLVETGLEPASECLDELRQ